ncbi:MAG TPA: VCBS repeat-containing protein [Candidatus Hydrogenedentes bacterium]|nr:VCBS repeat-containing protein [Candidatus Hydrogenedentota bacterium]
MTALALHFLLGAIVFSGQDLDGLWAVPSRGFLGQTTVNFRQADLNGDGAQDLIFAHEVLFQKEGRFPQELRTPLPDFPAPVLIDLWEETVYGCSGKRLTAYRWTGQEWKCSLNQELEQPIQESPPSSLQRNPSTDLFPSIFQRILYDTDGDKVPEIIAITPAGVYIYKMKSEAYALDKHLDLLPPLAILELPEQDIWPQTARRIGMPARSMGCQVIVETNILSVFSSEATTDGKRQYRYTRFPIEASAKPLEQTLTKPIPPFLRPCRLNQDPLIDFAGGQPVEAGASAVNPVMYETWATLDYGNSFQIRRSPSFPNFRPQASFLDFDGDGDLDMITEATGFFDSGIRESVIRFMTGNTVDHILAVYPQAKGIFSKKPELQARFVIGLGAPPIANGSGYRHYQNGNAFSAAGDFNGDRYHDVVLRETPSQLAVYLASGFHYPAQPDVTIPLTADGTFSVTDINGDGKSDIVFQWTIMQDGKKLERTRVFFAEEIVK